MLKPNIQNLKLLTTKLYWIVKHNKLLMISKLSVRNYFVWVKNDTCTPADINCSKLTIETLEQGVKYVQS